MPEKEITSYRYGLDIFFQQVRDMCAVYGHPTPETPVVMGEDYVKRRTDWIMEELIEALQAKTLIDQADAWLDVLVFAMGGLVEMGIPPRALMDRVMKANQDKIVDGKILRRPDGKVQKPEGWIPPEPDMCKYVESLGGQDPDDGVVTTFIVSLPLEDLMEMTFSPGDADVRCSRLNGGHVIKFVGSNESATYRLFDVQLDGHKFIFKKWTSGQEFKSMVP